MMKKFFLLAALLPIVSFAQDFNYLTNQHFVDTVDNENYEMYDIQFVTPSPEAITFKWEAVQNTFPSGWSYSICDQGGCYVGLPATATMNPISLVDAQNGVFGFIKLNLTTGSVYGHGVMKIYVYDSNDYNRGDTISFDITNLAPSSIQEEEAVFSVYPNPVVDLLQWEGDVSQVEIYDASGRKSLSLDRPQSPLNLSQLPAGMYHVLFNTNGQLFTQKVFKQ